ncbi:hypothetical protein EIP86_005715 [Pleurotus ostreatoroseus]|nr:hypothetical protein EIP86_005715 [Pleurotus ostreatoroseus]
MGKKLNISDLNAPRQLTRREKEEKEKKEAKERWWKMHEQGKTEQAKSDLARLAKIRAEREAAAAKRKAENEGKFLSCAFIPRHLPPSPAKNAEIEAKRKEALSKGKRI